MRKAWFLFLGVLLPSCVSSGPDPFLVDVQERTQKLEVLLQGEKKARERLSRRVTEIQDSLAALQEKLDRNLSRVLSFEEEGKKERVAGLGRLESRMEELRAGTAKVFRDLYLQVKTALSGLARVEKSLGAFEAARKETEKKVSAGLDATRNLAAGVEALGDGLRSLEEGAARAGRERAGILAELGRLEKTLRTLPAKFPRIPEPVNPLPEWKALAASLEKRLASLEASLGELERLWAEDLKGLLAGVEDSLRKDRGRWKALAARLEAMEVRLGKIGAPSRAPASEPFRGKAGASSRPGGKALPRPSTASAREGGPSRGRGEVPPPPTRVPPSSITVEGERAWDPVTGLGAASWPWLLGMGAFLFFLLVWALKGGNGEERGDLPVRDEEGPPLRAMEGSREGGDGGGKESPARSPSREDPSLGEGRPVLSSRVRAGEVPPPGDPGEKPPSRILVEIPLGREAGEEDALVRRALKLLEVSPLCLADPPVQVEPDRASGKIRVSFWVPGFALPEEIQELASRLERL